MKRKRRGMILIFVSVVIVILTIAAIALMQLANTEYKTATIQGDRLQCEQLVYSGIAYLKVHRNAGLQREIAINKPIEVFPHGTFVINSVVNESAKLSLHTVLEWENEQMGQGVAALQKLTGITQTVAESVLDWLDADDTARQDGAESTYYQENGKTYRPRNAVPVVIEELKLVRGVASDLQQYQTLAKYLTPYKTLLDVNAAPLEVLQTLPDLTPEQCRRIVDVTKPQENSATASAPQQLDWLVSQNIVNENMFEKLSKRIISGGTIFRFSIMGTMHQVICNAEVVIDYSGEEPKILQCVFR